MLQLLQLGSKFLKAFVWYTVREPYWSVIFFKLHPTGFACTQFKIALSENEKPERQFHLSRVSKVGFLVNFHPNKLRVVTQNLVEKHREKTKRKLNRVQVEAQLRISLHVAVVFLRVRSKVMLRYVAEVSTK